MNKGLSLHSIAIPFSRFSLFLIYFWFGALKVFGLSPASPMVLELLDKVMPFMDPAAFLISFGLFEVLIGILFLIPKLTKLALILLALHLVTVIMPLFILPYMIWNGAFVPSLEGQYIIKNILIVAVALNLALTLKSRRL